jgi:hypothetical protein
MGVDFGTQHGATFLTPDRVQPDADGIQPAAMDARGSIMRLTFIGKDPDSQPHGSPTVYRTDRASWVVQGWLISDPAVLDQMEIPDGESAVEIPDRIIHLFMEG